MTAINPQLASRLAQFKAWKAAKNSTGESGDSVLIEVPNPEAPSVPKRVHIYKPKNPLLKSPEFDFPEKWSESHGKIAWVSGNWKNCLRNAQTADDVNSRLPRGYYVDQYQDETVSGFVVQLPGHKRTELWLAGTTWSESDMSKIHLDEIFDCKEDAARRADHLAEKLAESEREWRENEEERAKETAKADAAKKLAEIEWASELIVTSVKAVSPLMLALHLGISDADCARMIAACETLKKLCDDGNIDVTNDWQEFRD